MRDAIAEQLDVLASNVRVRLVSGARRSLLAVTVDFEVTVIPTSEAQQTSIQNLATQGNGANITSAVVRGSGRGVSQWRV